MRDRMIRGDSLCRLKVTLNPDFLPPPLRVSTPHLASLCVYMCYLYVHLWRLEVNTVHLS